MPDVAYSVERDAVFDFHDVAVTHSWSQIYRNTRVQVRSIADLAELRVAVLRGGIQQGYVARLMAGSGLRYTPVLVDTYADGFEAVRQGRAEAVVTNTFTAAGTPAPTGWPRRRSCSSPSASIS